MGEIILAVPDKIVRELKIPEGVFLYTPEAMAYAMKQLSPHVIQEDRDKLEGNPEFRQFIPYISIFCKDSIFTAIRTKEGGDARLHGKRIAGFGGHANPVESQYVDSFSAIIRANASRELEEELNIKGTLSMSFLGFINDYSTNVNKDHLGIYMQATVDSVESVSIRETSVLVEGGFHNIVSLKVVEGAQFESWSTMVLEKLSSLYTESFEEVSSLDAVDGDGNE